MLIDITQQLKKAARKIGIEKENKIRAQDNQWSERNNVEVEMAGEFEEMGTFIIVHAMKGMLQNRILSKGQKYANS